MSDPPLLTARELARRHPDGNGWLLDHVSVTLKAGMRLALAGPSGSGKTLLMRALILLDPLESGTVFWRGEEVRGNRLPAFRREVVYLHQRPALLGGTVEEALQSPFALAVHAGRRYDRARITEWLARLGREASFLTKATADLSGGEMQIAALLRALQLDPTVLLFDEPTAALDPQTTAAVERLLHAWVGEGPSRATIWVSHDPEQSGRMADQVLQLRNGRVLSTDANEPGS